MSTAKVSNVEQNSLAHNHPDSPLPTSNEAGLQMSHDSQDGELVDDDPTTTEPRDQDGLAEEWECKSLPDKVIDVTAFLQSMDNLPIFTRKLL